MEGEQVCFWAALLVAFGCGHVAGAPTHPSLLSISSAPAAGSAAPSTSARSTSEHNQLFVVGETPSVAGPIIFDNRAFVQLYARWLSIDGAQLSTTPNYLSGVGPEDPILGATGSFPERAWLLVAHEGQPIPPLVWSGDGWRPSHLAIDIKGAGVSNVGLCRWGERHLFFRVGGDEQSPPIRSYFEPLEANVRVPEFRPAEAVEKAGCATRLVAESCFPLADGGLVVVGTECGAAHAYALEYFAPNAGVGMPIALPPARSEDVWISSASSSGVELYLGGSCGQRRAPYLARLSANGRVEELDLPASIGVINRVAADEDGSVWIDSPPLDKKIPSDGAGLWCRSASGTWTHVTIESALPGNPDWQVNIAGFGLFSAAGNVWFEASYFHRDVGTVKYPIRNLLYRDRETRALSSDR